MKRRSFLIGSVGFFVAQISHGEKRSVSSRVQHGHLVSPYSTVQSGQEKHGVMIFDLDRREYRTVDIPFAIHKVALDPNAPEIGFGVASYSNQIAKIDLKQGKLLAAKTLKGRFTYSGHSQVSKSGSIYATVVDTSSKNRRTGLVRIAPADLSVQEELLFPELDGLGALHDLQFLPDGKTFVTTGGGLLLYFDTKTKLVTKSHKIDFDIPGAALNHFAFNQHGDFGIQSATFAGGAINRTTLHNGAVVLFDGRTEKFRILRQSGALAKRLDQDLFGLCLNNEGTVLCVASLWDDYLTFWNMNSGALIKGLDFRHPTGVTLTADKRHFLVTTLDGLKYFDAKTLEAVQKFDDFSKEFAEVFSAESKQSRLFHSSFFSL